MFRTSVSFSPRLRCFYDADSKMRFRGAAKRLKELFWPNYSFSRAPEGESAAGGGARNASAGRSRGARVDREVTRAVNGAPVRGSHTLTGFALEALRRAGIQAVASQVVVHFGRCATAVDVVGRTANGAWVCVELKCSSERKYTSACGRMRGALSSRDDSIAQQHAVQCGVTRLLFERTYGLTALAYVLRVNTLGATLTVVPRSADLEEALAAAAAE